MSASIDHGLLDPAAPAFARHAGVTLPIATDVLESAAAELDLAVAAAEVHRSSPRVEAPAALWAALEPSIGRLLDE